MNRMFEDLITRDDIADVAEAEQLILDDDTRISILEAMCSLDVQACPGSGKTTLIATKLILLAKNWKSKHQGVCVLSHTNVAKDEIIDRIKRSKTNEAKILLGYPHFIGTIQDFVHRFLALPYIRSKNISNITVDDEEYAKQAIKLLERKQFGWLSGTLNGLGGNEEKEAFLKGTFRCFSQGREEINISKKPKAWKEDAHLEKAKRGLLLLKQYMDGRGCFLYRDMYTLAQEVCTNNNELIKALRERFPFVLLDEMQDTQSFQDELLCRVFPVDGESIVQRFGDPDQSIFHGSGSEEPNQSFNGKSRSEMDFVIQGSHRFDEVLSRIIKPLSFNEVELKTEISGDRLTDRAQAHSTNGRFEHTIIVFTKDTQASVVESFAQIVSKQFSTEYKKNRNFTVKVIGGVGKNIDPNAEQMRIGHYWADFDKVKSKTNYKETCLIDAVRHCQRSTSIDWADRYKFLLSCILKLMRMSGKVDENGLNYSVSTLRLLLSDNNHWERFRKGMYYLLNNPNATQSRKWSLVCGRLSILLDLPPLSLEAIEYMAFSEQVSAVDSESTEVNQVSTSLVSLDDNIIAHVDGFHVELSTIHGVKGETHDATLIVETKNHTFDIEVMMPYLTGELPSIECPNTKLPEKPNVRRAFKPNKVFMRQLYVAMSRPKHLLCFAVHSDHITDAHKSLLSELGWQIRTAESVMEGNM